MVNIDTKHFSLTLLCTQIKQDIFTMQQDSFNSFYHLPSFSPLQKGEQYLHWQIPFHTYFRNEIFDPDQQAHYSWPLDNVDKITHWATISTSFNLQGTNICQAWGLLVIDCWLLKYVMYIEEISKFSFSFENMEHIGSWV